MNPMAKAIVAGGYEGGDTIEVRLEDDALCFTRVPSEESTQSEESPES